MADKIGDYIHYNYLNYKKWGLAYQLRDKEANSLQQDNLDRYINDEKKSIMKNFYSSSKYDIAHNLQHSLNYFMVSPSNLDTIDLSDYKQSLLQHLQNVFGIGFTAEDFNWTTFTLNSRGENKLKSVKWKDANLGLSVSTFTNNRLGKSESGISYREAIKKQLDGLILATNKLLADGVVNKGRYKISTLQTRLNNLKTGVESLKRSVQVMDQTALNQSAQQFLDPKGTKNRNYTFLDEMRKISRILFATTAKSAVEGELLEAIIANCGILFQQTLSEGMNEVMGGLVTGSSQGTVRYDSSKFMKGFDLGKMLNYSGRATDPWQPHYDNGSLVYDFDRMPIKGKTDAVIYLKDNDALAFTAKSYNLESYDPKIEGISLVKETNLLYLFQTKARFLNHYLNQSVDTAPAEARMAANRNMRQMLLLVGMSGGGIRSDSSSQLQSSVMVFNNKGAAYDPIKVMPIDWLYGQLMNYYKLLNISLPENHAWPNTRQPGDNSIALAKQRISSLLMAVKHHKISVSIPQRTMKNIIDSYI